MEVARTVETARPTRVAIARNAQWAASKGRGAGIGRIPSTVSAPCDLVMPNYHFKAVTTSQVTKEIDTCVFHQDSLAQRKMGSPKWFLLSRSIL